MLETDRTEAALCDSGAAGPGWLRGAREVERRVESRRHLVWGLCLIAAVAVGGLYLTFLPGPIFVDRWVLDVIGPTGNAALTDVTALRFPQVIVVGACLVACVAFPTNRLRSLACLIGPPLALLTSELVLKPVVGRLLGGGLSYPSGSTTGAAALAAAAALAVPAKWRPVTITVGAVYTLWMGVAVVALGWHFPTDAAAGVAYGVGVVLVVDGSVSRGAALLADRRTRRRLDGSARG